MRAADLLKFMQGRDAIRVRKDNGLPRERWTKDEILATYRFCNIMREDDYVTGWIRDNWRDPMTDTPDAWFAMVVARLFNQPATLEILTPFMHPWKPEKARAALHKLRASGATVFNAAYIVSTNGKAMDKIDYLFAHVLGPLWAARAKLRPQDGQFLEDYHSTLMQYAGMGSFMAGQVVADLKYIQPLRSAADWYTFAAPGPGSKRGLNRVYDRPVDQPWGGRTWQLALAPLLAAVHRSRPHFHAQDLQNCLCEFDKYERARLGEGRPKQLYKERQDVLHQRS